MKRMDGEENLYEGFIGLHVGAGSHSSKLQSQYKKLCRQACREGVKLLNEGKSSLEVAERVTVILEDSALTNAGYGSTLTWDGKVECDASLMDGKTLRWGGVGAVPDVKNPIKLARTLCDKQGTMLTLGRVPPCLLVGAGAKKWAMEAGLEVVLGKKLIAARSLKLYHRYKKKMKMFEDAVGKVISPLDTVGVVCLDKSGQVAAACSSGGIALKHSGRVGQAGSYGSGVWAQTENKSCVAVCSSGCGEHLLRTMLAKEVATGVILAPCPTSALHRSITTHFLDSPFLNGISERLGGVAVLRVSENGSGEFLWGHTTNTMCLGYMRTTDLTPRSRISCLPSGRAPGTEIVIEGTSFRTGWDICENAVDD